MNNKRYIIPKIIYNIEDPTIHDDITKKYVIGQPWFNTENNKYFICACNDINDAKWININLNNIENEFMSGFAQFNGDNFPRQIYHGLSNLPTFISVFPIESPKNKSVGEIWASLSDDVIKVYNTGDAKTWFCWFVAADLFEYENIEITFDQNGNGNIYTDPYCGFISNDTIISFPKNINVNLYPIAKYDSYFNNWSGFDELIDNNGCKVLLDQPKHIVVDFRKKTNLLSIVKIGGEYGGVFSNSNGIQCGSVCEYNIDRGTEILLDYILYDNDYYFDRWEGCDSITEDGKCQIILNSDKTVSAVFLPKLPKLSIVKTGSGTVKTLNSQAIECGNFCTEYFQWDEHINLIAEPDEGSIFIGWYGELIGEDLIQHIQMTEDKVVGAIFEIDKHKVIINRIGKGTVISNDSFIMCGKFCEYIYEFGTSLTLTTENSNSDYLFKKWIINNEEIFENDIDLIINNETYIDAIFEKKTFNINTFSEEHGSIDNDTQLEINSDIVLEAFPNDGYEIDQWDGCDSVLNNMCYINNIQEDKNISVSFKQKEYINNLNGYVCGGYNTNQVSKFIFPFDSGTSVYNNDLIEKNEALCSNHSTTYAYICGGKYQNNIYSYIQRFMFSNDSMPINQISSLKNPSQYSTSNNSLYKGYVCSGNWIYHDIAYFVFPLDIGETKDYGQLSYIYSGCGCNSSEYGYVIGSIEVNNNILPTKNNEKFSFSTDPKQVINTVNLHTNFIEPTSCNSSTFGYISSGTELNNNSFANINQMDELNFSVDSGECVVFNNIENTKNMMAANNSTLYGYICGGYNSNNVRRIQFSIIGTNFGNEELYLHENKHNMTATDGSIF